MKLKALRKKPYGQWELLEIENSPEAIKEKIGGDVEIHLVRGGLNLVSLRHRGHIDSKADYNFTRFGGYSFHGTVLLFGSDEEDIEELGDVPEDIIKEYKGTTKAI